jgi:putative photosynthetic complex assembly protein 2
MAGAWSAVVFALFAWWFFTGAILLIVRRADAGDQVAHGRNVFLSVPFFALGFAGLWVSAQEMTVGNAYTAFLSVLLIWGWIELAFLSGIITGPERRPCPDHLTGYVRFARAWDTVSRHELLLACALLAVVVMTAHAENTVGLWTYIILFTARISAKLNLFFGVPRINTEFVPTPLLHIKSYFRRGPITIAFPMGVTFLSVTAALFIERLISAQTPAETVGFALLTALAVLAAIEHWFMVIPLPDAKLWRWMLPDTTTSRQDQTNEL